MLPESKSDSNSVTKQLLTEMCWTCFFVLSVLGESYIITPHKSTLNKLSFVQLNIFKAAYNVLQCSVSMFIGSASPSFQTLLFPHK